jgi:hypothetical protein
MRGVRPWDGVWWEVSEELVDGPGPHVDTRDAAQLGQRVVASAAVLLAAVALRFRSARCGGVLAALLYLGGRRKGAKEGRRDDV